MTSWSIPSTEMVALAIGLPWRSRTNPLTPRCICEGQKQPKKFITEMALKWVTCQAAPCFLGIHCRSSLFKKRNRHKPPANVCVRSFLGFPSNKWEVTFWEWMSCSVSHKDFEGHSEQQESLLDLWHFSLRIFQYSVSFTSKVVSTNLV